MAFKKKITAVLLAAVLLMLPNLGAALAAEETDPAAEFRAEMLRLVNEEREKAGLAPLEYHEELTEAAQRRAEEAAEKFSHTRPDGARWVTVFEEHGLKYQVARENLAKGFRTAAAMVRAWMNSEGHRANILASDYTYLGVGYCVREDGTIFTAQLFYTPAK